MTFRDSEITVKPNQFVAIIKGEIFHSDSVLDMIHFFETFNEYDYSLAEMVFDGVDIIRLLTCDDDQEVLSTWREAQKYNTPYLMNFYKETLADKAEFIIKPDFEDEEEEEDY